MDNQHTLTYSFMLNFIMLIQLEPFSLLWYLNIIGGSLLGFICMKAYDFWLSRKITKLFLYIKKKINIKKNLK